MEWGENVGGSSRSARIMTTRHSCDGWCLSARDLENIHGGVMEWGFVVLAMSVCLFARDFEINHCCVVELDENVGGSSRSVRS